MNYNSIYVGKAEEVLKQFDTNSIDLVVTSPPYKDEDGYSDELINDVFTKIYKVLANDGLVFLNFGHLAPDKFRPFRVLQILLDIGFKLNDTITWIKNHYTPISGNKRLNNLTEFIFILYKKDMPELNRLAIGVPYKDKGNVGRYSDIDLKCGGNVWYINYETIVNKNQKTHPDRFPVELPLRCLKLSGKNMVLDPFFGSGTTGVAATLIGRKWIGIEKDKGTADLALRRIKIALSRFNDI